MHAMAGTGRVIAGRYRLEEPIGRGAMGTVWRAWDEILDRVVAVKELRISDSLPPEERGKAFQRTHREARTAARLSHPGLVTVFDVAEEDGRPWIIMELVEGSSLDQLIEQGGPLPPHRAAEAGRQLLSALATAHAAGVLHRDVKPSNVLLTDGGRAVLTDFGIATFQGDPKLTLTGMVMGSPGFTAPERIQGNPATPASDLWSLGATLYAAVQGHGPFDKAGGAITTMSAIIHTDPPIAPPSAGLGAVIDALLRRNPADRPDAATAARMLGAVGPLPDAPRRRGAFALVPPRRLEPASRGEPSPADQGSGQGPDGQDSARGPDGQDGARGPIGQDSAPGPDGQDSAPGPADQSGGPDPAGAGVPPAPGPGPQDARIAGLLGSAGLVAGPGAAGGPEWRGAADPTGFPGAADVPGGTPVPGQDGPAAGPTSADLPMHADRTEPVRRRGAWRGPGNQAANPAGPAMNGTANPSAGASLFEPSSRSVAVEAQPAGQPPWGDAGAGSTGEPWGSVQLGTAAPPSVERAWETTTRVGPDGPTDGMTAGAAGRRRLPRRAALISAGVLVLIVAAVAGLMAWRQHARADASTAGGQSGSQPATRAPESPAVAVAGPASTGPAPAGHHTLTVPASEFNTTAGFAMAVPDGWEVSTQGTGIIVEAPGGAAFIQIDLTAHTFPDMIAEARYLAAVTQRQGKFPGYADPVIRGINLRGGSGAAWAFTWLNPSLGRVRALDLMYDASTLNGRQAYSLYLSSAASAWTSNLGAFDEAMRTFRPSP
jgi:tRNA A-37 threonylcarbamoyl transferase component Bud32